MYFEHTYNVTNDRGEIEGSTNWPTKEMRQYFLLPFLHELSESELRDMRHWSDEDIAEHLRDHANIWYSEEDYTLDKIDSPIIRAAVNYFCAAVDFTDYVDEVRTEIEERAEINEDDVIEDYESGRMEHFDTLVEEVYWWLDHEEWTLQTVRETLENKGERIATEAFWSYDSLAAVLEEI